MFLKTRAYTHCAEPIVHVRTNNSYAQIHSALLHTVQRTNKNNKYFEPIKRKQTRINK